MDIITAFYGRWESFSDGITNKKHHFDDRGNDLEKHRRFRIPLFLGNLFQQLYNMADSLIVGNFLGSNALAAVSSSGNLIFLLVGFFNGIAVGAGVVIARYFGAREKESLQRSIHTTIAFGLICGVVLSLVGVIFAPKILILMGHSG